MPRSQKSSRVVASRLALLAIIGGLLLTFSVAGTKAAPFSSFGSIMEFFGVKNLGLSQPSTFHEDSPIINPSISIGSLGVPIFSVLEGGYSSDLPELVLAYVKGLEADPENRARR